jgi:hypothetical protein
MFIQLYVYLFQKLNRRTAGLEMVPWNNVQKKGKAAEILLADVMSSEESCYEDIDEGQPKLVAYTTKPLSWESPKLKKIKKRLDKYY